MRVLLLLTVVAVAFASEECGENSHFESCGTACPLTCRNYRNPPKFCVLRCDIGCQCDEGYVKTDDGRCVRPEQCPPSESEQCGENAHFESCGTACPLTCDNYENPPKFCVKRCDIGCHCDKGFVKTADGRCVRPEECPSSAPQPKCGENAHFERCGTACPLTCDNYQDPPKVCVLRCDIGCQCDEGYVKTDDGQCVRPDQCPSSGPKPEKQNCVDEPKSGMCLAYFPMFYYDALTQKCRKFIYGGCGGNGNRYSSEEECMQKCQGVIAEETDIDSCDMPAESGVCRGFFPRFYFDRTTGTCQKFVYGGCGGNENNFETIDDCQRTCGKAAPSACLQEKEIGPCRARFPRFYFNKATGECEEFVYGGCQGNSNNFNSKDECEAVCKA